MRRYALALLAALLLLCVSGDRAASAAEVGAALPAQAVETVRKPSPKHTPRPADEAEAQPGLPETFELFGSMIERSQESLEFRRVKIGDEGLDQIREALDSMPRVSYLKIEDCGVSDEAMAELRDEYEGRVKVVWRVHFGGFSDLTDTKIIHAVAPEQGTYLNDKMCQVLRYCTETEYIDLGHDPLTSIEFCRYMPKLKLAIFSYNDITDLSPLESCPELYMLELFCCPHLSDLSPLAKCENLELLNFAFTAVTDISPLYDLKKLRLLDGARNAIPQEQIDEITARMPDCRMTFEGDDIHEVGWRKEYQGKYYDWYLEMREIFGYGRNDYSGKK